MPFAYTRSDRLEQQIDLVAVAGVAIGLVLLGAATMVWFESPPRGIAIAIEAVAITLSHLLLRWFRSAWVAALAAWTALTAMAAAMLWGDAALVSVAVVASFSALLLLQLVYRHFVPYLDGERRDAEIVSEVDQHGLCAQCTRLAPKAMAPVWCVSLLFMTSVTIGKPKHLCVVHARLNAIPASVFSMVFGWWGLPWGLVRTPQTLWKNLAHGGQVVDGVIARELYEVERAGQAGWFSFLPGVRSKPIAVLGLLLFMFIIFGSMWMFFFAK